MTNREIAQLLHNIASALQIKGANHFRIIAYQKAADSIEHLTSEVKDIWEEGKLNTIPGIGSNLAQHLDELFKTGKVRLFEQQFRGLSPALFIFLSIPGLGPKRAYQLTQELKINQKEKAIEQLEQAVKKNLIANLEGWGDKSQQELLNNIGIYKRGQTKQNRMPLPYADQLANELISYLQKIPDVIQVDALGSLRRKVATIGDIDLAVATTNSKKVIEAFVGFPKVRKIVDQGDRGATILLTSGKQVDLRVQLPQTYGSLLQYFTGSKHHNIRLREFALKQGLSLSEYGIKPVKRAVSRQLSAFKFNKEKKVYEFAKEEEFYQAMGIDWIPPELREDQGEIEAALRQAQGKLPGLPRLIEVKDIRGDLHIHSNFDLKPSHDLGSSSLEEILNQAKDLKYEYVGISDHNPNISHQNANQIINILKRRKDYFEQQYYSWKKRVNNRVNLFLMLEVDIDPKGNIALPNMADKYLDAFIVSVHSSFNMPKDKMTQRIISGLSHPKAKILGHPTGRLIGKREQIEVDWETIFQFCAKYNKALEINAFPDRLDLPDLLVREAVKKGIELVINTDSHSHTSLSLMEYGVSVARRGWAEKRHILNTMGYNDFNKWLKS